jgi:hypothetical protein
MLAHYAGAKSLSGTIRMSQEAKGHMITTDTELQFTRPNKIYLKQSEHSSQGRTFLLTSDGKTFSYDKPAGQYGPPRFEEPTWTQYKTLDLGDIYTATLDSIVDPNHLLNVAIGRRGDLERFVSQLASYRIASFAKAGSDTLYQIVGKYSLGPKVDATADFEMEVTENGDFRKFMIRQLYGVPNHPEMPPIPVTTTWESTLHVDGSIDTSLFKTVK